LHFSDPTLALSIAKADIRTGTADHPLVADAEFLIIWEAFYRKCFERFFQVYLPLNSMVCRFRMESDGAGSSSRRLLNRC
jgi:hypothetical protein